MNYLQFVSRIAEKAVVGQLLEHYEEHTHLPVNQSAYFKFHSTETALVILSHIRMSTDKREITFLVLPDLSAAFDTVHYKIMLEVLELEFGVSENELQWIKLFLSVRKQFVCINQVESKSFDVSHGVPQGNCLGPSLFLFYVSKLFEIINKYLPNSHGCADDSQVYLSFRSDSFDCQDKAVNRVED